MDGMDKMDGMDGVDEMDEAVVGNWLQTRGKKSEKKRLTFGYIVVFGFLNVA